MWHTELSRKGPGLLLRDILSGEDPQVEAVLHILDEADADVIVLSGIDWDAGGAVLSALAAVSDYPHAFAGPQNGGRPSGLDIDGDGRWGEPEDAVGYGRFAGEGGLAVLSRHPLRLHADLTATPWGEVAGLGPPDNALAALPVSTAAHWDLAVSVRGRELRLLVWHATPPVFDGPEDRNGRRNHDEAALWSGWLDDARGPRDAFLLAGFANLDVARSEGRPEALRGLIADPRLRDPRPSHPASDDLSTVEWRDVGRLRVDYILPSRDLRPLDGGVLWPSPDTPLGTMAARASRHRLVWIDLDF